MTGPITRHRDIESLKAAARWPGADRNTTVILATRLAAARADAGGYRYFAGLAGAQPGAALPLTLAGFFQARLGEDVDAALAKLDQAAAAGLGPPQYFRGLALAGLPPDRERAARAVAGLEFVLAVADQFPPMLLPARRRRDQPPDPHPRALGPHRRRGRAARARHPGDHPGRLPRRTGAPAGRPAPLPVLHRSRREHPGGRRPRSADQPADLPDRREHRACPVSGAGRGNLRRADGPPPGQRRAVRRRRADALPGAALRRRRLPRRAPGDPRLHRQLAAPPAPPRPRHAHRGLHRRGGPRPRGGTDPAARRSARRHPPRPHPPRHPGYWQPDGTGLEPATAAEHAAALDLLAGGSEQQFAAAATTLLSQGDHALALQTIIQPGLLRHPASITLAGLRRTALQRLMETYQQSDPFKFLIYAELAGAEIGPVE